jgi:hypothetical protein
VDDDGAEPPLNNLGAKISVLNTENTNVSQGEISLSVSLSALLHCAIAESMTQQLG